MKNVTENLEYELSEEPIILAKGLIDTLLKTEKPGDSIALYTFYYYTAKWQKTNKIYALNPYVQKGLKWSKARVIATKKELISYRLIVPFTRTDKGKITGHFLKINFIWGNKSSKKVVKNHSHDLSTMEPKNHSHDSLPVEFSDPNALSTVKYLNALNTNICDREKKIYNNLKEIKLISKLVPPLINEVKQYFKLCEFKSQPEKFFFNYSSVNWQKGKNKILDWQAAANLWELQPFNKIEMDSKQTSNFNERKKQAV